MRKLGIGFMGAGDVSILHGHAVQANPDARLVGLWNRSPERGAAYPGVVRQILTHNLYTLIYLAGRPRRVTALKAGLNHPGEPD